MLVRSILERSREYSNQVAQSCEEAVQQTAEAIKDFLIKTLPFISAVGIIIVGTGWLYGFTAVSLPLSIGIGCGIMFGAITGFTSIKGFEASKSFLGYVRKWIEDLEFRDLVIAVAVTVILAVIVGSPYVGGAIFGIILGNHFIFMFQTQEEDSEQTAQQEDDDEVRVRLQRLEERLQVLEDAQ